MEPNLSPNLTPGASVTPLEAGAWHLEISPGPKGRYRLAQLDDYANLRRKTFPWHPPLTLSLRARVSSAEIPGTWGFGLWNDPFVLSLGFGGGKRHFPALPDAAWFFCASPQNYLSFRDDRPAQGFLAQTFRSPQIPAPLLALGLPLMPLLAWPWAARKWRSLFRQVIWEDSKTSKVLGDFGSLPENPDITQWHAYTLKWGIDRVAFKVDGELVFETRITPKGPLGLVLWIDNQFAAFPPDGRLSYGTLSNPEATWLEVQSLSVMK